MATSLPIVDLRRYPSSQELGAELLRVGKDPGFFYVIGHDLGDDAASRVFQLAHSFFDRPRQDKEAFANGSGDLVCSLLRRARRDADRVVIGVHRDERGIVSKPMTPESRISTDLDQFVWHRIW